MAKSRKRKGAGRGKGPKKYRGLRDSPTVVICKGTSSRTMCTAEAMRNNGVVFPVEIIRDGE